MSAVDDALSIISQANISGVDAIYGNNLPQSEVDSANKTVVLITDAARSFRYALSQTAGR